MDGYNKFRKTLLAISTMPNKDALMEELTTEIDADLAEMKTSCPDCYWKLCRTMHEVVYDSHFTEYLAKYAVSAMITSDGSPAEYFNAMESEALAASIGIDFNVVKFNKWDWYFTMNMMHADYASYLTTNKDAYVNFSKMYLMDVDAPEGKAYKYWAYVVKS